MVTTVVFTRRQTAYLEFTQEVVEALMDMTLEEYLDAEAMTQWEIEPDIDVDVLQS